MNNKELCEFLNKNLHELEIHIEKNSVGTFKYIKVGDIEITVNFTNKKEFEKDDTVPLLNLRKKTIEKIMKGFDKK